MLSGLSGLSVCVSLQVHHLCQFNLDCWGSLNFKLSCQVLLAGACGPSFVSWSPHEWAKLTECCKLAKHVRRYFNKFCSVMLDRHHRQHALCKKKLLPGVLAYNCCKAPLAHTGLKSQVNLRHYKVYQCWTYTTTQPTVAKKTGEKNWTRILPIWIYNCRWQTTTVFIVLYFKDLKCI